MGHGNGVFVTQGGSRHQPSVSDIPRPTSLELRACPGEHFFSTTRAAAFVIGLPAVSAAWEQPSALAGYSVGGLAGHLARAAITVDRYLDDLPPSDGDGLPDSAAYFVQAIANHDPLKSSNHIRVRERGEEAGSIGPEALVAEIEDIRRRLTDRLLEEPPDRRLSVFGGASMGLNCYLETRSSLWEFAASLDRGPSTCPSGHCIRIC